MHMLTFSLLELLTLQREYEEQVCEFSLFRKLNFTRMNNLAIMLIGPNESIWERLCGRLVRPHAKSQIRILFWGTIITYTLAIN